MIEKEKQAVARPAILKICDRHKYRIAKFINRLFALLAGEKD
jgi:hypothetical protein